MNLLKKSRIWRGHRPQGSSKPQPGSSLPAIGGSVGMAADDQISPGARMPRQVDYYFSLQSPWAYIGHRSFRDVAATYDLKVNHKPVVLVDLFSETGGLPLAKRHPGRQRYRMVAPQPWGGKPGPDF